MELISRGKHKFAGAHIRQVPLRAELKQHDGQGLSLRSMVKKNSQKLFSTLPSIKLWSLKVADLGLTGLVDADFNLISLVCLII